MALASLMRSDTAKEGRKQLVGLLTDDPAFILPEGAQIVAAPPLNNAPPGKMIGHVTSSYFSPILQRSIAFALVKGGLGKMGESVTIPSISGGFVSAKINSLVFYDVEGVRQHVE